MKIYAVCTFNMYDCFDLFRQLSFTSSNFSMAFPYVAISDEEATLENSLVSGFTENCGNGLGVNRVAYVDSCSISGENLQKLNDFRAVKVSHPHI